MTLLSTLSEEFSDAIVRSHSDYGNETVQVDKSKAYEVLKYLKENEDGSFNLLLDLCGVDYQAENPRFEVVYHLYSMSKKKRIRVKVKLAESDLKIQSVTNLWEAANWFEREAFEMFGIQFEGHPKLQRLLTWDAFEGYPLRKDYPLDRRQAIPVTKDIL